MKPSFFAIFINNSILEGGQTKSWGGQTWTNDGQSFAPVKLLKSFHGGAGEKFCFVHNFFLKGGQTKIFVGQTWTNDGQTNAIEFF